MKLAPILREGDSDLNDALAIDPEKNEIAKIKEKDPNWSPTDYTKEEARLNRINDVLEEICSMDDNEYEKYRVPLAKEIGYRVTKLDDARKGRNGKEEKSNEIDFEEIEPWPEEINPHDVLDELVEIFERFIVMKDQYLKTLPLWIVASWIYDQFDIFPYIVIKSPEKRCGKTRLLEMMEEFTSRPIMAANISTPAMFRSIEKYRPCLLIDEVDRFLKRDQELIGIINAGYRSKGYVLRCIGDNFEPKAFKVFCPKVFAQIGRPDPTIIDRSILLTLHRKIASQRVGIIESKDKEEFKILRRKLKKISETHNIFKTDRLDTENDREADNWFPLLCVAESAGGHWPQMARVAAKEIGGEVDEDSIRIMLLEDFREHIFPDPEDNENGIDKESSENIINKLHELEERPWATYGRTSRPISKKQIANMLKQFSIYSSLIRFDEGPKRGYEKSDFIDAWNRYTPSPPPFRSVTTLQPTDTNGLQRNRSVTPKENVTDRNHRKPTDTNGCNSVTDWNRGSVGCVGNTAILDNEEYKEVDENVDDLF